MVTVAQLITSAFHLARAQSSDLYKRWLHASYKVVQYLPASTISISVQRIGEIDLVLRAMEDEMAQHQKNEENPDPDLTGHYLHSLSQAWVASSYEIIRLLNERHQGFDENFKELYHLLTILRVPLEKHQIAAESKLKQPLIMDKEFPEGPSAPYIYSNKDPKRSIILPAGLSERGSAMWCAPDVKTNKSVWIERRSLSEHFLSFLEAIQVNAA